MEIKDIVRKNILNLAPYSTARDEYQGELDVYLDANENPFNSGYNRYPDPYQKTLKEKISKIKSVGIDNIFLGNGSDEPIDIVYRVFCEPGIDNVVAIAPTYGMYRVAADINNIEYREVMLNSDYQIDVDRVLSSTDSNTKIIFLCSPNNPTANTLKREDIETIIREFKGVVVIDEAYIDFADDKGFVADISRYDNIIILQTLSKAWGMAGLRLGIAISNSQIISIMTKVKYPYNINVATQNIVLSLLGKNVDEEIEIIKKERETLINKLNELLLIKKVYPSDSNFVLVVVDNPKEVYNILINKGIVVRDRSRIKGCTGTLRLTIGTPQENKRLIETLKTI